MGVLIGFLVGAEAAAVVVVVVKHCALQLLGR